MRVKEAWDKSFLNDDNLIFGFRSSTVDLSTLHPEPVQIFRLWHLYLENVNPLLRVTHAPTMQGRIIEAVSDMKNVNPIFEALLFGIYSMAIVSVAIEECPVLFGLSKSDLLTKYQFGCQQALLNCGFLRCSDRDCLTALYLYMARSPMLSDIRDANCSRYQYQQALILEAYLQSLVSLFALPNACELIVRLDVPNMACSKAKCVGGFGGRSSSLTVV